MFQTMKITFALTLLLASVQGCASMSPCGGYGGCDTCGGGCETCGGGSYGGGCDECSGGNGYCGLDWFVNLFHHDTPEWGCPSCGETYWGDKDSCCDACDACGNYAGNGYAGPSYQQSYGGEVFANNGRRNRPQGMNEEAQLARAPRAVPEPHYAQRPVPATVSNPQRATRANHRDDQVVRAGAREEVEPPRDPNGPAARNARPRSFPVQTTSGTSERRNIQRAVYDARYSEPSIWTDPVGWLNGG